jgi:lipoprotein-anchoring transpeptidase ErfK/SrfK
VPNGRAVLVNAAAAAAGVVIALAGVAAYPPARATMFGGWHPTAGTPAATTGSAPPPLLAASVADGARDVGVMAPLTVTVLRGTLGEVSASGADGKALPGTFSTDRTSWTSQPLAFGTDYTLHATAKDTDGRDAAPLSTRFRTVDPTRTLDVLSVRPGDGDTVGVAMPISINFTRPVTDRASVERALRIDPSVPTEGSFYWFDDQRIDWRPKDFWTPGTKVTVEAPLRGVSAGGGTYGDSNVTKSFTVGAAHEAVGDARTHTLTMYENGKPVRTLPASFGKPEYQTHSGIHVAMQKFPVKEMRSDSWPGGPKEGEPGFYDAKEPWAVRISNNGEFVHVNTLTVGQQGRSNVSHGCVNLSMANGLIFYNWVQVGDPVNIVGTSVPLSASEGDIGSWVIPWDQYQAGSALHGVTEPPIPGLLGTAQAASALTPLPPP